MTSFTAINHVQQLASSYSCDPSNANSYSSPRLSTLRSGRNLSYGGITVNKGDAVLNAHSRIGEPFPTAFEPLRPNTESGDDLPSPKFPVDLHHLTFRSLAAASNATGPDNNPTPNALNAPVSCGGEGARNTPSKPQPNLYRSSHTAAQQPSQPPPPVPPQGTSQQQLQEHSHIPGQSVISQSRNGTELSHSDKAITVSGITNISPKLNNSSCSGDAFPSLPPSFNPKKHHLESVRGSTKRHGPLLREQRMKAAVMRKLGACDNCRVKKVACQPSHLGRTWSDAIQTASKLTKRTSQGTVGIYSFTLPSGLQSDELPVSQEIGSRQSDLQTNALSYSRISSAQVLMLYWQNDPSIGNSVRELGEVFGQSYLYEVSIMTIPFSSESCKSPWRWLLRKTTDFMEDRDQRDVLKIFYYNGYSYLDKNREMVLASSNDKAKAETIRWSGVQMALEEACSDTLIIMDAAFFPSSKMHRQQGVLELVAAAVSEEHFDALDRCNLTKLLIEYLKTHALCDASFSAASLHSELVANCISINEERVSEKDFITSLPSPFHMQVSGNVRLPSILLTPTSSDANRTSPPLNV